MGPRGGVRLSVDRDLEGVSAVGRWGDGARAVMVLVGVVRDVPRAADGGIRNSVAEDRGDSNPYSGFLSPRSVCLGVTAVAVFYSVD
jgi:hypothetical protein